MAVTLGMSQPKQLPLPWTHLRHRRSQHHLRVGLPGAAADCKKVIRNLFDGRGSRPAPVIAQQVGRNPETDSAGRQLLPRLNAKVAAARTGSGHSFPASGPRPEPGRRRSVPGRPKGAAPNARRNPQRPHRPSWHGCPRRFRIPVAGQQVRKCRFPRHSGHTPLGQSRILSGSLPVLGVGLVDC